MHHFNVLLIICALSSPLLQVGVAPADDVKIVRHNWSDQGSNDQSFLTNSSFEKADSTGQPAHWQILTGLDQAAYGEQNPTQTFDAIQPVIADDGRAGDGHCLAFPAEGTWHCRVRHHHRGHLPGTSATSPGMHRGKAAAYQLVKLPPGTYRFSAHLRTADGGFWTGAFSLGVSTSGTTEYAHDSSTGIRWSEHTLAMKSGAWDSMPETWGEWRKYQSAPIVLETEKRVSVWIRFNYVNREQNRVRWQVDDAAIERTILHPAKTDIYMIEWDKCPASLLDSLSSFELHFRLPPKNAYESLDICFRASEEEKSGYELDIKPSGQVELRSRQLGSIHKTRFPADDTGTSLRLRVQSQYLRLDLPVQRGFERHLIGPRTGRLGINIIGGDTDEIEANLLAWPDSPGNVQTLRVPEDGEFQLTYDPSIGRDQQWYINDHCFVRDQSGLWQLFGITHAEPANPLDEDFFAHATTDNLTEGPWTRKPPVCHVNTDAGETHVWAPHIVKKDDTYYMFYCGGGEDHDAYQINLRTSKDLEHWQWHPGNPLFTDIGDARDPMVLMLDDGTYLMYYTRPSDLEHTWSSVAIRESTDLLHWSEPQIALQTFFKNRFGRLTESPFVFATGRGPQRAYYLSATGIGGYRGTLIWRSVNPRRFNPDHVVSKVNAHAPEWITTAGPRPSLLSHCGWGQGGVHLADVKWTSRSWPEYGALLISAARNSSTPPPTAQIYRATGHNEPPYRTYPLDNPQTRFPLPPGLYRVIITSMENDEMITINTEIVAGAVTEIQIAP